MADTGPILILGAGISGLLLAQKLRQEGVPFRLFERDAGFETRGVGWGLTLNWSLPTLRELLPPHLARRIPETYVDRGAVERDEVSTFPFFDLSTGKLEAAAPSIPESQRIRVTRERFRRLLATGLDIEWGKSIADFEYRQDSVTVQFEDGSSATGGLLVACDGAQSRVRRALFGQESETYKLPVCMMGTKFQLSPEQMEPMRKLDPFFLQGNAHNNDSFLYFSLLDAPKNHQDSTENYVCQLCVSWPRRGGFFGRREPIEIPSSDVEKHRLLQDLASTWAEPFRTLAKNISSTDPIKGLVPQDFAPPRGLHTIGRVVLMGDALHAMSMFRGEGANHVIVDVKDFVDAVVPQLHHGEFQTVRTALDRYEDNVIKRTRPAVLASRQACLDAHDHTRINKDSPVLTKREMFIHFQDNEVRV